MRNKHFGSSLFLKGEVFVACVWEKGKVGVGRDAKPEIAFDKAFEMLEEKLAVKLPEPKHVKREFDQPVKDDQTRRIEKSLISSLIKENELTVHDVKELMMKKFRKDSWGKLDNSEKDSLFQEISGGVEGMIYQIGYRIPKEIREISNFLDRGFAVVNLYLKIKKESKR